VGAAIATIGMKGTAYFLTGSVALLSDALESFVNLAGALLALGLLMVAFRPEDEDHAYGHGKAEYFASGAEGILVLGAALSIAVAAARRIMDPYPIEQVGLGLAICVAASIVNLLAAGSLRRASLRYESVTLDASARHLMTDVWTSAGVVLGAGLASLTGWLVLDPLVALAVALHILWAGLGILGRSVAGLMDAALPVAERQLVQQILDRQVSESLTVHALRTRRAGARRFVSFHALVPGTWSVQKGHDLLERVEAEIREAIPNVSILAHLEPRDDPASFADERLDRT
jgi:cation diffusion facilitator family transporter